MLREFAARAASSCCTCSSGRTARVGVAAAAAAGLSAHLIAAATGVRVGAALATVTTPLLSLSPRLALLPSLPLLAVSPCVLSSAARAVPSPSACGGQGWQYG